MSQSAKPKTIFALAVGFLAGALSGYLGLQALAGSKSTSPDTVATVNGEPISAAHYRLKIAEQNTVEETQLNSEQIHKRALDDLIDVHLLTELASREGLFYSDATLGQAVRNALMAHSVAESIQPTQAELKQFYAQNGSGFREPARVLLQRMVFRGSEPLKAAQKAHALLLDGADFATVKAQYASPDLLALPNELVPADGLIHLLGESLTQEVVHLPRGGMTEPFQEEGGYVILSVLDNEPARKPSLNTVRQKVLEHYLAYQREQALQSVLSNLKKSAVVSVNESIAKPTSDN